MPEGTEIRFDIPTEVQSETMGCPHNFSCLTTGKCGGRELCKIAFDVASDVALLQTEDHADCPYRKPLGSKYADAPLGMPSSGSMGFSATCYLEHRTSIRRNQFLCQIFVSERKV